MSDKQKKILIIRPGAIGDVVHTTIIPKSIKEAHPEYIIHYLTQKEIAPILEDNPYIDKVISFDRSQRKSFGYVFSLVKELFSERYDIIFNLTLSVRNIMLSILALPGRIVFRKHTKGLWVEDFFYSAKSVIPDIKIAERLFLGRDNEIDKLILERLMNYPKPYIMLVPAGNNDKNRQGRIWDIKNWKTLSEMLVKKYGGTVFVCGSKNERELHNQLVSDRVVVVTGEYSLKESANFLSHADLVISGDTGPLHIASAYNVNTLALLGSTSPDKIKPYGENGHYISANTDCKYCWKKKCDKLKQGEKCTPCMNGITPDIVTNYIDDKGLLQSLV